jgi:hypothetical protein
MDKTQLAQEHMQKNTHHQHDHAKHEQEKSGVRMDRHSGSGKVSSPKGKKAGGGAHAWGSVQDEIKDALADK